MPKINLSPYQLHKAKWSNCTLCELHQRRKRVCLLRGTIPCDVLFIGEAPGINEDVIGQPFVGPAGSLLDRLIADAGLGDYDLAFANLLGCVPKEANGQKSTTPPPKAIKACAPRLDEVVDLCQPVLQTIVRLGEYATKHFTIEIEGVEYVDTTHPAAILRMNEAQKPLAIKRVLATFQEVANSLVPF